MAPVTQLTPLAPTQVASVASPPKLSQPWNDYSDKQQYNIAGKMRNYFGPEAIQRSMKQHFREVGNKSAEFILDEISSNPNLANDVKEFIRLKKRGGAKQSVAIDPLDHYDCLSLLFKEDMSTTNWTVRN